METAAVKAYLPKPLKRQAFAAFALRDLNFSRWAREQLEAWLQEIQTPGESPLPAQARGDKAVSQTCEVGRV
jgi:hypothetical protein